MPVAVTAHGAPRVHRYPVKMHISTSLDHCYTRLRALTAPYYSREYGADAPNQATAPQPPSSVIGKKPELTGPTGGTTQSVSMEEMGYSKCQT